MNVGLNKEKGSYQWKPECNRNVGQTLILY